MNKTQWILAYKHGIDIAPLKDKGILQDKFVTMYYLSEVQNIINIKRTNKYTPKIISQSITRIF